MKVSIGLKRKDALGSLGVVLSLVMVVGLWLVLPAKAQDTDSVNATVTVQNISVSVSDGSVAYGTLSLNSSNGTNALADTQTAQNDGNVSVNFNIRGQDSNAWTLSSTPGANQYVHQVCTATCAAPPTNYAALTTNYQTIASEVASSGTQVFDLYITTPTTTSDYSQQSVDVTIQATLP